MNLRRVDASIAATLVLLSRGVDLSQMRPCADEDARRRAERKLVAEMPPPGDEAGAQDLAALARAHVRKMLGLWPEA